MTSFDDALKIVCDAITTTPELINQLPHDILRKLILCVGMLPSYIIVDGQRMRVSEVEKALNIDTYSYPFGACLDVKIVGCSHCDTIHLWAGRDSQRMNECSCVECCNVICDDCYKCNILHCGYCDPKDEDAQKCAQCI